MTKLYADDELKMVLVGDNAELYRTNTWYRAAVDHLTMTLHFTLDALAARARELSPLLPPSPLGRSPSTPSSTTVDNSEAPE